MDGLQSASEQMQQPARSWAGVELCAGIELSVSKQVSCSRCATVGL